MSSEVFKSIDAMRRSRKLKLNQRVCALNTKTQKVQCYIYKGRKNNVAQFDQINSESSDRVHRLTKLLTKSKSKSKSESKSASFRKSSSLRKSKSKSKSLSKTKPKRRVHRKTRTLIVSSLRRALRKKQKIVSRKQCGKTTGSRCHFLRAHEKRHKDCMVSKNKTHCVLRPKYNKKRCGYGSRRNCVFLRRNGIVNPNCEISKQTRRCIKSK